MALLDAREERRRHELQFLGRLIAYAVNSPKDMDKELFKDSPGQRLDDVTDAVADYEQWWPSEG